jgi:hypothetical protein
MEQYQDILRQIAMRKEELEIMVLNKTPGRWRVARDITQLEASMRDILAHPEKPWDWNGLSRKKLG